MTRKCSLTVVVCVFLLPLGLLKADDQPAELPPEPATVDEPLMDVADTYEEFVDGLSDPDNPNLEFYDPPYVSRLAVRFGWWGVSASGNPAKVGMYQDLESSPFWDVDGIHSNGSSTIDFFASGLDNEATHAGVYYYGHNGLSADVDYQRFMRHLLHEPLVGYQRFPGSDAVGGDDLNVGEDYAIRVQKFDAKFKGPIGENIRWGLNLWGMRKSGTRQANATQHCYNNSQCHVQSQGQRIDWLTTEIEPVIEAKIGCVTVEYSRPMRSFNQNDQTVSRLWNHFGYFQNPAGAGPWAGQGGAGFYDYALVPENFTQIDRLKIGAQLAPDTHFYANLFTGNTENKLRNTKRMFSGVDLRVTDQSLDQCKVTGYFKWHDQRQEIPGFFLGVDNQVEPFDDKMQLSGIRFGDIHTPINREWTKAGVNLGWTPFYSPEELLVTGGYEWSKLQRRNAAYVIADTDFPVRPPLDPAKVYEQPDTTTHKFHVGAKRQLTCSLDSYVRYKVAFSDNPLYGLRLGDENYETGDLSTFSNTNLPEQAHRVEIGGTWTPADNFLVNAYFGIENTRTANEFASFEEDNYPIVVSAWWAPNRCWAISGGYAYYTNWIDQDITIGFRDSTGANGAFTDPWSYNGHSHVLNLGVTRMLSECLTLTGGLEYVTGINTFENSFSVGDWTGLPAYSAVNLQTWRLTAGADYVVNQNMNCYFRYNYLDYEDRATGLLSGQAHMLLGGVSGVF